MKTDEAIMAFSQSEKIKAGLIWSSQALELLRALPEQEKKGAETVVGVLLNMVGHEVGLGRNVVSSGEWDEIEAHMDRALSMVHSGVGHEGAVHLARALSRVTNIGLEAMTVLKEKGLL